KRNGSGIGLSLCKQIIVNHGGEIDVVSSEGEGCCVTISLPRMIPLS
ncbi:MAG: HAMP domain-containing histidine kinase, partial [Bacteroidaceae bacterium]|nr:HAMP domain-containing histidine kinase [Bacteroidaceae bacterium]